MTRVAVVGAGHSVFGDRNLTLRQLFHEAFTELASSVDRNFDAREIEEAYIGSLGFGGGQLGNLGPFVTETSVSPSIPCRRVENACASSGYAFRDAVLAVKSGERDLVLAGGIERMNDLSPIHKRFWLGVSGDTEWERTAGLTFAGVYALMAERHMIEHGTKREALAAVAVKNHANGAKNPKAQFRKEITIEKALQSAEVASPLHLFDCCSTTDGATAVLVASEDKARELTDTPIWVTGSGASSDHLALMSRKSLTRLDATTRAARDAFAQAGRTVGDVDVAEVHDCFTIAELMAVEDLGFVPKGEGGRFASEGRGTIGDRPAINPSGGLKAKGHPLGATGTGQVYEVWNQLRGQAGERQVVDAEVGLTHNVGGSGASAAVHVLER
jgi:acetyl-CoA acetyltransferase